MSKCEIHPEHFEGYVKVTSHLTFNVVIGAPRCGKSTYIKSQAQKDHIVMIRPPHESLLQRYSIQIKKPTVWIELDKTPPNQFMNFDFLTKYGRVYIHEFRSYDNQFIDISYYNGHEFIATIPFESIHHV